MWIHDCLSTDTTDSTLNLILLHNMQDQDFNKTTVTMFISKGLCYEVVDIQNRNPVSLRWQVGILSGLFDITYFLNFN